VNASPDHFFQTHLRVIVTFALVVAVVVAEYLYGAIKTGVTMHPNTSSVDRKLNIYTFYCFLLCGLRILKLVNVC